MSAGGDLGDGASLEVLAEAVDTLRSTGFVSLRTLSNALNEAIITRSPDSVRFALSAFHSLDGDTRQEIASRAIRRAYERAQRHQGAGR